MDSLDFFQMLNNEIIIISLMSAIFLIFKPTRELIFLKITKTNENPSRHVPFLDYCKGVGIISVITIHVCFLLFGYSDNSNANLFFLALNNFSRFAIAVFFICSAILAKPLSAYGGYFHFLKKKFLSVILPYVFITVVIANILNANWQITGKLILTGKASLPFYFVIVLTQFYLLYPLLDKYKNKKWFLPLSFSVSLASFYLPSTWYLWGANTFPKFLFFFCYGLRIKNQVITKKLQSQKLKLLLLVIFVYTALFFIWPSFLYNVRLIYGVIIFHTLFFLFQKNSDKITKFFEKNGQISLWLFLLHYPILEILFFLFKLSNLNLYILSFSLLLTCYALTLALAWPLDHLYKKFLKLFYAKQTAQKN